MSAKRISILLVPGLVLMTIVPALALAARSRVPVPPTPPSPPDAIEAPSAPMPPGAPQPPVPPEWVEAPDAEFEEWFGDLDPETFAMAADPEFGGDDVMAWVPEAGEEFAPAPEVMMLRGGMAGGHAMGPGTRHIIRRFGGPGGLDPEMMAAIRLSDAQQEKLRDLRDARRRDAIRARADLQIAALDLRRMLAEEHADRAAINAQIDKIAQQRAELRKAEIGSMLEAREVLTLQQRQQLKAEREKRRDDLRLELKQRIREQRPGREVIRIRRRPGLEGGTQ